MLIAIMEQLIAGLLLKIKMVFSIHFLGFKFSNFQMIRMELKNCIFLALAIRDYITRALMSLLRLQNLKKMLIYNCRGFKRSLINLG